MNLYKKKWLGGFIAGLLAGSFITYAIYATYILSILQ